MGIIEVEEMSVILLPIVIPSGGSGNSSVSDEECANACMCLTCLPCIIVASPFYLMKKLWECCVSDKKKKKEDARLLSMKSQEITLNPEPKPFKLGKHTYEYEEVSVTEDRMRKIEILKKCREHIGSKIWELIERGSHNKEVVEHLKTQPLWVLKYLFEDLLTHCQWQCGKDRMLFLRTQVGYTSMPSELEENVSAVHCDFRKNDGFE
jgi:hypothetical protein